MKQTKRWRFIRASVEAYIRSERFSGWHIEVESFFGFRVFIPGDILTAIFKQMLVADMPIYLDYVWTISIDGSGQSNPHSVEIVNRKTGECMLRANYCESSYLGEFARDVWRLSPEEKEDNEEIYE